jgi:hypothetical protein
MENPGFEYFVVLRSNFVFFEHNLLLINQNSKDFESVKSVESVALSLKRKDKKRHGFHGFHRSLGCAPWPRRVFRGFSKSGRRANGQ